MDANYKIEDKEGMDSTKGFEVNIVRDALALLSVLCYKRSGADALPLIGEVCHKLGRSIGNQMRTNLDSGSSPE